MRFTARLLAATALVSAGLAGAAAAQDFSLKFQSSDPAGNANFLLQQEWAKDVAAKTDGRLLRLDPTSVVVHTAGSTWTASLPSAPDVRGRDLPGPPGSVLSAAWRSA